MASPTHRPSSSLADLNSTPHEQKQKRRLTSPATALNIPDSTHNNPQDLRPPSPLRNGHIPDTSTGILAIPISADDSSDEDPQTWRSPSPTSSVLANFVQRVESLVTTMSSPRSPHHPSDAEIEAEAERERDRSRREAEKILTREAEERRLVEERVLFMMADRRHSSSSNTHPLPPPPRSHTLPNPPSPSPSQKEGGSSWWAAAKNKLTPTKEPLTPAQEIIRETKAREKEMKKMTNGKGKEREKEWPAVPGSTADPAFLSLSHTPLAIPRKPVPTSPSSPTPSRSNLPPGRAGPPILTPSPMRSGEPSISPIREAPPLYAQFNSQGTLDVPGTLLIIAKRFEKLEKWTVGHVRALEERMGDVERWLVDKEKEKENETPANADAHDSGRAFGREVNDMKEELSELQGRVSELGREMAGLVTSPANLASGPSVQQTRVVSHPQTTVATTTRSSFAEPVSTSPLGISDMHTRTPTRIPSSSSARESTSPPLASQLTGSKKTTRLPYPTGDYAVPPPDSTQSQNPGNSPTGSMSSITGLPGIGLGITGLGSNNGREGGGSPTSSGLPPPPKPPFARPGSVSPTPRKRYTVALGGPIIPPAAADEESKTKTRTRTQNFSTTTGDSDTTKGDGDGDGFQDETIGKSASKRMFNGGLTPSPPPFSSNKAVKLTPSPSNTTKPTPSPPNPNRRIRAQSAYGFSSIASGSSNTTQLQPQGRSGNGLRPSRSTDRFAVEDKFVDPVLSKKREGNGVGVGKVPVGQLVAFFDGEK